MRTSLYITMHPYYCYDDYDDYYYDDYDDYYDDYDDYDDYDYIYIYTQFSWHVLPPKERGPTSSGLFPGRPRARRRTTASRGAKPT